MVIVGAGKLNIPENFQPRVAKAHQVICADGGAAALKEMGILPHVVIGDLDSITCEDRSRLEKKGVTFIRHPVDKDATDTELAVAWALKQGATHILLLGTTGTRMDHSLANILLMERVVQQGVRCTMADDHNEMEMLLGPCQLSVTGVPGSTISLIPLSRRATGVGISGVDFPLEKAVLERGSSLSVSNRLKEKAAKVSLETGVILMTQSRD